MFLLLVFQKANSLPTCHKKKMSIFSGWYNIKDKGSQRFFTYGGRIECAKKLNNIAYRNEIEQYMHFLKINNILVALPVSD